MQTLFATDRRLDGEALEADISAAIVNPLVDGLLNTVSGLLAVLNEHRQILALNDSFLKLLGIDDPQRALGQRPGEALACIYHDAGEGGCGTSAHCVTCGAAIALVTCLDRNATAEKDCALTVKQHQVKRDLFLRVRACPAGALSKYTSTFLPETRQNFCRRRTSSSSSSIAFRLNPGTLGIKLCPSIK